MLAPKLTDESIAVTIPSPPYWGLKNYGVKHQIGWAQDYGEYLNALILIFRHVHRAAVPSGSLWIVLDTFRKNGSLRLLPFEVSERDQDVRQGPIQQRLIVPPQSPLDETRVKKGGQRVLGLKSDCRSVLGDQSRRRHPLPRRPLAGRQAPNRGHVVLAEPGLGQYLLRDKQADLDAHPRETDAITPHLSTRGNIVVAREVAPAHSDPVIHDGQRGPGRIGGDGEGSCSPKLRARFDAPFWSRQLLPT